MQLVNSVLRKRAHFVFGQNLPLPTLPGSAHFI